MIPLMSEVSTARLTLTLTLTPTLTPTPTPDPKSKVHLVHELRPLLGLLVEHGEQLGQRVAHGRRLVVRDAVESEQRAAPHLEVGEIWGR